MSESIVQKKLAKLIQQELGEIIRKDNVLSGGLVSVSVVRVPADLGMAKVYLTVFPDKELDNVVNVLNESAWNYRHLLAGRIKNKVRKIPEIRFYPDDSFREADKINQLLDNIEIKEEEE